MTTKSGMNGDSLHSRLVLSRELVTRAELTTVHRSNGPGVPLELRNSEVLEQVLADERRPQLVNSRKLTTTKGSIELSGSLDKDIDVVSRWDRPFALGLYRNELVYLGSRVRWVIRLVLSDMRSMVLARTRRERSQIWNDGTGGVPMKETRCEEVQIQDTTCPLSHKHSLL